MEDDEVSSNSSLGSEEASSNYLDSKSRVQEIVPSPSTTSSNWIIRITENKTLVKFTQRFLTRFYNFVKVLKVVVHWAWMPLLLWLGSATIGRKTSIMTLMFPFFDSPTEPQKQQSEEPLETLDEEPSL
jgi:hypothetical protein